MKTIRSSPITRATAWLVTVAMVTPCLIGGRVARAQTQQPLRVIIADIVNKSPAAYPNLGITATAAIYNEMVNSGQGRFSVFQNSEVLKEADALGIRHPSNPNQPANFRTDDLNRIAINLNADAVVEGDVSAGAKGKGVQVALQANLREIASKELINGGYTTTTTLPRPGEPTDAEELTNKSVSDAAQDVVRQVMARQLATGTVIGIETDSVILNKGVRDGVKIGDDVAILREGANGQKLKVGQVKVVRIYPTDCEATIINNPGGIRPEDSARVLYQPPVVIGLGGPNNVHSTSHGAQFTLTALGSTLAVIGLGVLVAQASRGGQASTTSITAEPGVASSAPIVRVKWQDNIFGQGNVQQYKIYREPDFPFGQSAGTGGTNGGTTNGGSIPIGVVTGVHEFDDHGSPFFPYQNGLMPLTGNGDGNPVGGSGGNTNGTNGGTSGCGSLTVVATLDTGFKPGNSYHYLVTAIILRQLPSSSGSGSTGGTNGGTTNGGGTGNGGTTNGGGTNGGSTNGGGFECIETDPSRSGQATPINPVLLTSPANNTASVNVTQFAPQFTSRNGADLFQIEVSTDRTFSNPSLIFHTQLISSAPNADGVAQTTQNPIDLTQAPELLRDPAFKAFVATAGCSGTSTGTSGTPPTLYWRVGARHDGDQPGPIDAISQNASDPDQTFRFVYSQVFAFVPAPLPPCPPGGRAASNLNRAYASGSRAALVPLGVGSTKSANALHNTVQTPQQILMGNRKRN